MALPKRFRDTFEQQEALLEERAATRRKMVTLVSNVLDDGVRQEASVEATLGKRQPQDEFEGDCNYRTIQTLLKMIDERGFERSPHQLRFHDAFLRATARVIYRADWATQKPEIMKRHGWDRCSSEVLISTPRRFGKTFS